MQLVFYYIILPFVASYYLIKWLKKNAAQDIPDDVKRLYAEKPVERKWLRAVRRDTSGLRWLGDFETRQEAVESAYQGRKDALAAREQASFIVLNDKGEALEQVDS
jgi:hypothetical protein